MRADTIAPVAEGLKTGTYKNIVITTHHKPDGDAMGSSLGLYLFLKRYAHVQVITPTDYADFLNWLPGNDDVLIYEGNETRAEEVTRNADLIFCLDFNRLSRINEFGEVVRQSEGEKVLIDHHLEPENFEDYTFWDNHSSSTAELIYHFIREYFGMEYFTKDIATNLYCGLMTDTGNFQHNNTNATTHRVAADLIDCGIHPTDIHEKVFDVFSENRSRLFGYCMYEKLQIIPELRTALIYLTREELERFQVVTGDTEGLVNLGLGIKNIVLSVLIIDRTKLIKMSFRSKGTFAVNEYAEKYFHGGGHKNASGGQSEDTLENTVNKFKETIALYREELQKI
ncbi:MAG: bifunctional oligoribonuclease/PAP phosphatase NrnA [Bacteroidetes bacterium]|nr:bifunctional oligoribonuclease/PAP phosphatase NrnA [Bacteroidota bacterium]